MQLVIKKDNVSEREWMIQELVDIVILCKRVVVCLRLRRRDKCGGKGVWIVE